MRSRIGGGCVVAQIGVVAVLLAGCGGGGGGNSASGDIEASVNALIKDHDCSAATAGYRKDLTGDSDVKACSHALAQRNKVEKLTIGKVTSSGDSGTAAVTTDGDRVSLKLTKQDGKWLIASDTVKPASSSASSSPSTTPTTSTPKSAPTDQDAAKAKYVVALAGYHGARVRFRRRVLEDIKARNLAAVKGDFSQFRDAVFAFDGQVRKIDVPASARADVNTLLEANRTEIADLDAVGSAQDFSELQRLLTTRLQTDDQALNRAVKRVAADL